MGYSLKTEKGKFSYLLDNEFSDDQMDALLEFVDGSKLVIWDGMFTEAELEHRKGWGHSSIEQACLFADNANIDELRISHHSPSRTDNDLDILAAKLNSPKASFAVQSAKIEF